MRVPSVSGYRSGIGARTIGGSSGVGGADTGLSDSWTSMPMGTFSMECLSGGSKMATADGTSAIGF